MQAIDPSVPTARKFNDNKNFFHAVVDFFNKSSQLLWFCLTPEDSTETVPTKQPQMKTPGGYNARGAVKTGFWIVMSLILAVLLGQLH